MRHSGLALLFLTLVTQSLATPSLAQTVSHPLDPLSWNEYWGVLEVLQANGHLEGEVAFSLVQLVEPAKNQVWGFRAGDAIPRSAKALLRKDGDAFRVEVDLVARKIVSVEKLEGVETNFLAAEIEGMGDVVKADPHVREALARRGYDNLDFVTCAGDPAGYYATPEQKGRRWASSGRCPVRSTPPSPAAPDTCAETTRDPRGPAWSSLGGGLEFQSTLTQ